MKFKKIFLLICLLICVFSMASVCASEANDTAIVSEDTDFKLSADNEMDADNLQTSKENTTLTQANDDETVSAESEFKTLGEGEGNYTDLRTDISENSGTLTKSYYCYQEGDGDTIEITTPNMVINGNGAIIDMLGSNIRAFMVSASGVTIKNLTIKNVNCREYGAIYFISSASSGTVENCNFTNNKATSGNGGAIWIYSGTVTNCNFTNNTATYHGGAIWIYSGNVTNCNFTNNRATNHISYGGAICFWSTGTVSNCNFTDNHANEGGAVHFWDKGTVENCNFANNHANGGGAIYSYNWASTADTCIFKTGSDTTNINVIIVSPKLNVDNFTTFYGSVEKLTFNLTTDSGMPVNNGNISISVYFKDNNAWVGNYSCLSGEGWTVDLPIGSYYAIFDTEYAEFKPINRTITVNKVKTGLFADSIIATYNINKYLVITLKDSTGKALGGVKVTVNLNGIKEYITDSNGQVKVATKGLAVKTYTAKITFNGNNIYDKSTKNVKVTVKKANPKLTAKKKTFKKAKKVKMYTVTLKDNVGKAIKKAKVIIKIGKKTYKATTNAKGKAKFKIKLTKKGKYKATVNFTGNSYYNKVANKVEIVIK